MSPAPTVVHEATAARGLCLYLGGELALQITDASDLIRLGIEAAMGQLMIPAYPAPFAYTANQAHLLAIASDALALAAGRIA